MAKRRGGPESGRVSSTLGGTGSGPTAGPAGGGSEEEPFEATIEVAASSSNDGGESSDDTDDDSPKCICKTPARGQMVACDAEDCAVEWFHFRCAGLTAVPEENSGLQPSLMTRRSGANGQ